MKKLFPFLFLVAVMLGGGAAGNAQSELSAALTGANEVPAVVTGAFGSATFDINLSENTLGMNYNLSATNLTQAFMAHIHCGPAAANGPIVVWLAGSPGAPNGAAYNLNGPWIGSAELTNGNVIGGTQCQTPAGPVIVNNMIDVLTLMFQGLTYVNIHSRANPGGEIRGQITVVAAPSVP